MPTTRSAPGDAFDNASNQSTSDPTAASAHLALVPTWVPWAGDAVSADAGSSLQDSNGSGGDGFATGVISSTPKAVFTPDNTAMALGGAAATADQTNHALVNQQSAELAGIGGNGGLTYGMNLHAGSGGNGTFAGALVSADVGVFAPVNTAVAAGPGAHATASQSNGAAFLQDTTQVAGAGGNAGATYVDHSTGSTAPTMILNGDLHAGSGGDGTFVGTLTDINVAIYSPINIAVAGAGGTASATQDNNVLMSQGATQIAGVGGAGGGFYIPSDTIMTGSHSDGSAGSGQATGSMVGVNVAYYDPMNIAVPAGGTAEAEQLNHLLYDQHTVQVGGIGGDAGTYQLIDSANAAQIHDALHLAGG